MGIIKVRINEIHTPKRELNNETMASLRASMADEKWQPRPLVLAPRDESTRSFLALTGSHRLAAARLAGRDSIPAVVVRLGTGLRVHVADQDDPGLLCTSADGKPIARAELEKHLRQWDPEAADVLAREKKKR
ncbi:hypothetical protein D7Y15_26170 [Corallococcus sp. AB030]|uniref:ParB N-terminal domain-containing protein n=1 Tax=Corallococcus sp. AB030 TaxID=2316716 RepID=UPI000EC50A04|nr:ParB N-terminal domain-containing protein [Corallococcus sp. AB030]RKI08298.1 hypothetical protein D7Y15_26170 [Corallococcus sp. AB030]